jgi:hypothetical protein
VRIVKKKLITLLLALALCMSMAVCAAAAPVSYVVDEIGYLAPGEIDRLNDLAQQIYEDHGVGSVYVYTTADTLADYDVAALVNGMEDYFVMLENSTSWYSFCGGKGTAIDEEKRTELRRVYDATQTYVQGVEDYLNAAAAYFPVMDTPILPSVGERLVFDAANLLTEEQADELNRKLGQLLWLGNLLVEKGRIFDIAALTGRGVLTRRIAAPEDLKKAMTALLSAPAAESGTMEDRPVLFGKTFHIGGEPDEP